MTLEQLDHLKLIDSHLDTLLALAAKRTPGEWTHELSNDSIWNKHDYFSQIAHTESNADRYSMIQDADQRRKNAAFIAACAGRAEAGWRATKAAIKGLSSYSILAEDMEEVLNEILAAWPIELLTLP